MLGSQVLLLNTVGRKSGRKRTTPLLYLRDGGDYVIVASKGGAPAHPAWYYNLKASPETTVQVGASEVRVRAEEASLEEKARLWPKLVEMYPSYEDYQKKTDREIPVIVLHPEVNEQKARSGVGSDRDDNSRGTEGEDGPTRTLHQRSYRTGERRS
jgi:deazaflavin-dependent oxidoreductase (nitroreductase family)